MWHIHEFVDGQLKVNPDKAKNTTVQLYVDQNDSDHERYSEMYVISTLTGDTLQRLPMTQQAACVTRADGMETSNRIYGAGFGYNTVTGKMAPTPLARTRAAIEKKVLVEGGVKSRFNVREYTGSCFSQLANNLKADAKFSGKKGGFEGEVSSAFDMKTFEESNKDYVMSKIDAVVSTSNFEASEQAIADEWLTDQAVSALNGLDIKTVGKGGSKRERTSPTMYPTNNAGFKKLIHDYGTHFIRRCNLGGQLTYATTIDLSKVESEYTLSGHAKCGYNNSAINASAQVDASLAAKYNKSRSAISTQIYAHGGSKETIQRLKLKDNDDNINAWIASLREGANTMMVNPHEADLIPLYQLVEDASRANALKRYMTEGQMERDFQTHEQQSTAQSMGIMPHINNISKLFTTNLDYKGTLIKDLYVGGTLVARACAEFIPKFSMHERSIVIYPVCDNFAKYNMGYFIGNSAWKPQYVCFLDNGDFTSTPVPGTTVGAQNELYMCGSTFFSPTDPVVNNANEQKPVVTAKNASMKCQCRLTGGVEGTYNEPIVKIYNRIWTRGHYNETVNDCNGWYGPNEIKKFTVQNWYMAATNDYENLFTYLKNANISLPAQYMSNVNGGKDLTGFNIEWNRGWRCAGETHGVNGNRSLLITGTRQDNGEYGTFRFVEFDKNGKAGFMPYKFAARDVVHKMHVRMVQPLNMQIPKK